jgi:hypothetical protein
MALSFSSVAGSSLKKIPDCDEMAGGCDNFIKRKMCVVHLYDHYFELRDVFKSERCASALNRCNAEIQRQNYYDAECRIFSSNYNRTVVKSCKYHAVEKNRWGRTRINATYKAKAKGSNPQRVKDRACRKAYKKCMRGKNYYERCIKG